MLELRYNTSPQWLERVLEDFDSFLIDHAACERKASATGMAFVVRYPDREAIIEPMIAFAREELEHFHIVYKEIASRGLVLGPDEKDPYVGELMELLRFGRDERFMDRLLIASVIEARGCERFGLIAQALPAGHMKDLYIEFWRAEARHQGLFLRLARAYFSPEEIHSRLQELLEAEAKLISKQPLRPALH